MSVKNCSRDVLVSRNCSQMSLDESVSKNTCKKMIGDLFSGLKFLLLQFIFGNIIVYELLCT